MAFGVMERIGVCYLRSAGVRSGESDGARLGRFRVTESLGRFKVELLSPELRPLMRGSHGTLWVKQPI